VGVGVVMSTLVSVGWGLLVLALVWDSVASTWIRSPVSVGPLLLLLLFVAPVGRCLGSVRFYLA
jgi:hypothetical protein